MFSSAYVERERGGFGGQGDFKFNKLKLLKPSTNRLTKI